MTDTEHKSPAATPAPAANASPIDDADLDQIVGGDAVKQAETVTMQDFSMVKHVDKASPK